MPASTQGREGGKSRGLLQKCPPDPNQNIKGRHTYLPMPLPTPVVFSPPSIHLLNLGKNRRKSFLSLFAFSLLTSGPFFPEMKG